jgi:NAD(P)H-binding
VLVRATSDDEEDRGVPLNPIKLGRRSRQAIDDAWYQLTRMTSSRASFNLEDDLGSDVTLSDYEAPQAQFARVLVVGGTGKVGRIVVRKLLLRGYTVRVMVRDSAGDAEALLPASVDIFRGDVGILKDCLDACTGMDKVCPGLLNMFRAQDLPPVALLA